MKTILIGEHYTFDKDNTKLIMFIIEKGRYVNTEESYYDTISLNPFGEIFQNDLDESFFESNEIRLSTKEEIELLRSYSPIDVSWVEEKMVQLISKHWGIDSKPKVLFDPIEPLERQYYAVYDSTINTILFRSEFFVILKDIQKIEKILLHELCHWYLFISGQNWRDKDVRFVEELIRVEAIETANIHNPEAKQALEKALIKSNIKE